MCPETTKGSLFCKIIHLDCRSPDRLVREELHNSVTVTNEALSVFEQLIIVTLACCLATSILREAHSITLFLFLLLPMRQRQIKIFDNNNKKKTLWYLVSASNTEQTNHKKVFQ